MIFYKPISDMEPLKNIFPDKRFKDDCVYGGYITEGAGEFFGKILVEINAYRCEIIAIETNGDEIMIEGLIRAALTYAGNRNAYIASCTAQEYDGVLTMLGFEKENGVYTGEIPELLQGTCCKTNKFDISQKK